VFAVSLQTCSALMCAFPFVLAGLFLVSFVDMTVVDVMKKLC